MSDDMAHLAHDLRTPLVSVRLAAELLLEDLEQLDAADVRQMLTTIQRGTQWMQELMKMLLPLAARQRAEGATTRAPLHLGVLFNEIMPAVQPVLVARSQRLEVLTPPELPAVLADPQRIGQVGINLLANAGKFAAANTIIQVVVTARADHVRMAVQDRGPGLPVGEEERLFEPFHQAPRAHAVAHPGVGLGLAIAQTIVVAHEGRMGAENRRGGGARMWFELPTLAASWWPATPRIAVGGDLAPHRAADRPDLRPVGTGA